ncbi:hypothetical protein [Nocardia sp. NPDC004604]|uniref:hypothetical protein n=1 Tax=Nocardia sp. NPDC004604 TaxID=3157013 RepID=UPI0033ACD272
MARKIELDAVQARRAARAMNDAGDDLGEVLHMLKEGFDHYMNPSCAGTGEIADGFDKNCGQLMDNLVKTLEAHHTSIVGQNGLAAAFVGSTAALGKADQASADAFKAASDTLEA